MALCSDLLVIADDAKIGYPPARVWGSPTTAMWAAPGRADAGQAAAAHRRLADRREAEEWGLATEAAPAAELDERFEAAARAGRADADQPAGDDEAARQPVASTPRACTRPRCSAPSSTASPATPRRATASSAAPPRAASRRRCGSATSHSATTAWRASACELSRALDRGRRRRLRRRRRRGDAEARRLRGRHRLREGRSGRRGLAAQHLSGRRLRHPLAPLRVLLRAQPAGRAATPRRPRSRPTSRGSPGATACSTGSAPAPR